MRGTKIHSFAKFILKVKYSFVCMGLSACNMILVGSNREEYSFQWRSKSFNSLYIDCFNNNSTEIETFCYYPCSCFIDNIFSRQYGPQIWIMYCTRSMRTNHIRGCQAWMMNTHNHVVDLQKHVMVGEYSYLIKDLHIILGNAQFSHGYPWREWWSKMWLMDMGKRISETMIWILEITE